MNCKDELTQKICSGKGRDKKTPWLVCQTLPIFVAREVIDRDEVEFTELQLEQELGDDERDLGLALRARFNVVWSSHLR
jgi:hypothetical protein